MAVNFNVAPYYDDFSEDKNFHRVLFRPAYAVQARELTQLQTILQNQLERFGEHVFKDGSQVIPGEVTLNTKYEYVKLASHTTTDASDIEGLTLTGATSGVEATVVNSSEASSSAAATLYVTYTKTGTDNSSKRFTDGETLTFTGASAVVGSSTTLPTTTGATGQASAVNVQAGVYFINGYFVTNTEQTLILDAYTNIPSYRVGWTVTESFVTPETDTTLNDNATGSSNVNAPGSHRFKIALTLAKKSTAATDDTNFVELLRVKTGTIEEIVKRTDYNILEDTLARRTADESGDYVIKPFDIDVREHKNDGSNRGIYSVDADSLYNGLSATNSEARLAIGLSPGKAYVKGYELDTTSQKFLTIEKAREFDTIQNSTTRLDIGSSINVTKIYGLPDLGTVSGETTAFKEIEFFSKATATRGTANSGSGANLNYIGAAHPRYFEYVSGTAGAASGNTTSVYKLGLFNVTMFTHLVTTGSITVRGGEILTGKTSGATAIIDQNSSTTGQFIVANVKGTFVAGEQVYDETTTSSGTTATLAADAVARNAVQPYTIANVKQVGQTGTPTFTADTVVSTSATDTTDDSYKILTGSISIAVGAAVIGQNTRFTTELITGDEITFTDDTGQQLSAFVATITSDTAMTIVTAVATADITTTSPFARKRVRMSNIDQNSLVYKLPSDVIKTLKTTANLGITDTTHKVRRTFVATLTGAGVNTFSAGANEVFDAHAEKDFTLEIMTTGAGGTGSVGDLISVSGSFTLGGSPTGRQVTIDLGSGYNGHKVKFEATITRSIANEKTKTLIEGQTLAIATSALATEPKINLAKADAYALNSVYMAPDFSTTATTSHTDITDRFTLDTGQRDAYYDVASIDIKDGAQAPTGRLLINFDYFSHGSGDYFSVDSYAGVVDYSNIPSFDSPTKGRLQLRECVDFRPRAADSTDIIGYDVKDPTGATAFTGSGSSASNMPKPGSDLTSDFEFYLSRIDSVWLTKDGLFKQSKGTAAVDPQRPDKLDDAMVLYRLELPAYTFNTDDVNITTIDNRRYTMRDIGKLESRIKNIEYYTQLSLLEQTAINTQIQDASTGLDRFKNGIVVDSFKGHNVGDVISTEYKASVDMAEGELRPKHFADMVGLEESAENNTDALRTTAGYQKTGDLITLPYTHSTMLENDYATKSVNCNPFLVFQYVGDVALTPDLDEWKDVDRQPDLIVNDNNLFDTISSMAVGGNSLGTVWNEWQNNWTGRWSESSRMGNQVTTVSGTTSSSTRTGITREIAGSNLLTQSYGDKVVDVAFIPFIRSRTISFSATRLKPNTRVYSFFDNVDVSTYVTPTGGVLGGSILTDSVGSASGTFAIPNTSTVRFRTGERVFRLTSSSTNATDEDSVDTFADARYTARGLQVTQEETIVSTRVPIIQTTSVSEQDNRRTVTNTSTQQTNPPNDPDNWENGNPDPLAQTFRVDPFEGLFLTKVDLYFAEKDSTIPIKVYLVETHEGRPSTKIIPFSEVTIAAADVNTSATAATATTVTFPSPVYLQGKTDYAIVLKPDSQSYKAWVSRLGDTDVLTSTRRVTTQPLFGSLFRSQNASLWTEDQMEDLKVTFYKAAFTTGTTGTYTAVNSTLDSKTLSTNAIETNVTAGSGTAFGGNPNIIKVNHTHHGMNGSAPSKVTISGLTSATDYNGIAGSVINGTHSIGNVTDDTYTVTLSGDPATATGSTGGSVVVATQDRAFEVVQPVIGQMVFPDTTITHAIKTTTTQSIHGAETAYTADTSYTNIVPNDNFYFTDARAVLSDINQTTYLSTTNNKSVFYKVTLYTTNANVSPVIDTQRTNLIAIHNKLDSPTSGNTTGFVAETDPTGGSVAAKYVTREVVLENPATSIDMRLSASIYPTSSIEVYYKTKDPNDERSMIEIPWVQMTQANTAYYSESTSQSPYNANFKTDFYEYQYNTTGISEFSAFKIKIVMKGTNPAYPPRLTDMRTIALAT